MKLSDAFLLPEGQENSGRDTLLPFLAASGVPALECTALVLNINYGKNRSEVVAMSFREYDAERHLKGEKEDSYDEGFQKGVKQGIESEKINTLREKERADAAESRADAEKDRADAAEQELLRLREELLKLRGQLAGGK